MTSTGRFTLPSEENFAEKTKELAELWGADAIRNSDGTHLDEAVLALGKKIYSAYFPTRAHNEWITLHMDETPQVYLLTARILAESNAVDVPLMDGFFEEQLKPNRDADPHKYWEVVDRSHGRGRGPVRLDARPGRGHRARDRCRADARIHGEFPGLHHLGPGRDVQPPDQ